MKFTWLGQAGLLIEAGSMKIMLDPYFSDSCGQSNPKSHRRMPVDERIFSVQPDVMIITHNHLDHLDHETLARFLKQERELLTLSSEQSWNELRKYGGHRHVLFAPGTVWTEGGVTFTSLPAVHSEPTAIGVTVDDGEKMIYVTGDTLYNSRVIRAVPTGVDAVFLPINGQGNNMNATDAAKFAQAIGAKCAVPVHWGMFDSLNPSEFPFENKMIPEIFREITL